jgi:arylsulfatase A-like enzyme
VLVETPVSVLDLPQALAQLAGAKDPGYTLLDAVADPTAPRPAGDPVVSETYMVGQMRRAIVSRDGWKLIVDVRNGGALLYDLNTDPGETVDRYGDDASATQALEALYQGWLDRPASASRGSRPKPPR